jgi:acetyltransferase
VILIRPIRSDDAPRLIAFMRLLSDESRYFRFMNALRELPPALLRYFVEIDFDYDMALLAIVRSGEPDEQTIGIARYFGDDDAQGCEFAIAVADDWHRHGLGHRLMQQLFHCARDHGYCRMHGDVLAENSAMLQLMLHLGFRARTSPDDPTVKLVELDLSSVDSATAAPRAPQRVARGHGRSIDAKAASATFHAANPCP